MRIQLVAALFAVLGSNFAHADADCPEAPKDKWMKPLDLQKRIVNEYGFSIKKFEVSGNCYEIYGWGPNDKGENVKIEVYFNPVNGDIVKKEIED